MPSFFLVFYFLLLWPGEFFVIGVYFLVMNLLKEKQMPVTHCYSALFYLNHISLKKHLKNIFPPSPAFK